MTNAVNIHYIAPPTVARFMRDNSRVRILRGPIGSGKSTGCAEELFRRMLEQAPGPDGIRRTQMAVVRNTGNQLRTTCLTTVLQLFGPLAHWKPSTSEVLFEFGDVKSSWLLLPLDTPDNIRRLLSLELTMAWCSEIREIQPSIVNDVYSRCGRFPSKLQGGCSYYGLIGETNSFSEDSEWNPLLEENLPENWAYFIQPPGCTEIDEDNHFEFPDYDLGDLVMTGENTENLPDTYYSDQILANGGMDSPWVRQYIMNEIAPSVAGEAVFRNSFARDFHVSTKGLETNFSLPLCIGLDTGRNPAATITQIDPMGRMLVLGECWASNCGMEQFIREHLGPLLYSPRYNGAPVYLVIDPAGVARSEIGEESVLLALRRMGFAAVTAQTNAIAPRLRAVEKWLQQSIGGKAAILFDAEHCPTLILAMASRYRYKKRKDGAIEELHPEKLHPYSDCCFVAGTPVLTPTGYVAIEQLQLGDSILTFDGVDTVVGVGVRFAHELLRLELSDDSTLTCTPDHPFLLQDHTVISADELGVQHELANLTQGIWGAGGKILTAIKSERVAGARVYNLTTARTHLYYAGAALVHNCDSLQYSCLGGASHVRAKAMRAIRPQGHAEERAPSSGGWT